MFAHPDNTIAAMMIAITNAVRFIFILFTIFGFVFSLHGFSFLLRLRGSVFISILPISALPSSSGIWRYPVEPLPARLLTKRRKSLWRMRWKRLPHTCGIILRGSDDNTSDILSVRYHPDSSYIQPFLFLRLNIVYHVFRIRTSVLFSFLLSFIYLFYVPRT